jgi:hypothetical protein
MIQRVRNPKPGLIPQFIQDRADKLNQPSVFRLDNHTKKSSNPYTCTSGEFPAAPFIH